MIELHCNDNLKLLTTLNNDSIQLIYCDILFGTNKKFEDYKDNLISNKEQWTKFYKDRLIEMYRVLSNTGLIYIHCDYNLSHYIKLLLDEIFDISNFRNEIIWYFNSAPRKRKDFGKRHNTIFRYSKTGNYYFNENSKFIRTEYSKTAPRGYEKEKYYNPLGKVMDDVWYINSIGQNDKTERVGYSTQKPLKLLYPIIDSSSSEGDLVADFFLGSGTTAIACKKLNRNFLGCDNNQRSIDITNYRLSRIRS